MTFVKGQSGNPGGRAKGPSARTELIRQLKKRTDANETQFQAVIATVIREALAGKQWAVELIFDRLDGKVPQPQQVMGDGGGPVRIEAYDIRVGLTQIAPRSEPDRLAPIEAQVLGDGSAVGQDDDGG